MTFTVPLSEERDVEGQLIENIRYESFHIGMVFWEYAKKVFKQKVNPSPFVYFDQSKKAFCISKGFQSEELDLEVTNNRLKYKEHDIVISPLFYQKFYQKKEYDAYVYYESARLVENYLLQHLHVKGKFSINFL